VKHILKNWLHRSCMRNKMRFPAFDPRIHESIISHYDYTRMAAIGLALARITKEAVRGSIAEAGVYKGEMSKFIHTVSPDRKLFLFDTFEGFSNEEKNKGDTRFQDTSVAMVLQNIGDEKNITVRKGLIPATFSGLENEVFAFVLLDLDKFTPSVDSLKFFYPRLARGGYLFMHDYNSAESDWACRRAFDGFMADKIERIIELPDHCGTALIRKV
jgi:O-methyltransferase